MKQTKRKIAVVGLGYVGLPTFVAVHKTGLYDVVGYTKSRSRVDSLYKGKSLIDEPEIDTYLSQHASFLTFSTSPDIFDGVDIFLVCVPTPVHEDFSPNYGPVISATDLVAPYVTKGSHYVLESTVNPGTCRDIVVPILEKKTGLTAGEDFNIAHCPERVNPGDTKWTVYNINRNIGSINPEMNKEIAAIYRSFIPDAIIHEVSSLEVAEATKIVENSFRDINIAFVNELAKSFDKMGINLHETLQGASNKPFAYLPHWPGAGVGGHCIAVDPYYLIKKASQHGFDHKFLKLAREINNSMPAYTVEKLMMALNIKELAIKGTKIALLGLSYKPNIGDLRDSPAFEIQHLLQELGADLHVYDPYVEGAYSSLKEALTGVQAVVLATAHAEFITQLPSLLPSSDVQVVIDGRNCLDAKKITSLHITYQGIGR